MGNLAAGSSTVPMTSENRCDVGGGNDHMIVYVSAVEHPSHFWVQLLNAKALELEELSKVMTHFYGNLREVGADVGIGSLSLGACNFSSLLVL